MNTSTSKVLIVNDSGHDFSKATMFGPLVIMTKGMVNRFNVTQMFRIFEPFIRASYPHDYILHTGPGVMTAVACSMFAARHGRINLLLWRGEEDGEDKYVYRRLTLNRLSEKEEISNDTYTR